MEAGRQIREERTRRAWTLRTLAERAGVARHRDYADAAEALRRAG